MVTSCKFFFIFIIHLIAITLSYKKWKKTDKEKSQIEILKFAMKITLSDFNNTQSTYALQYNTSICINGVDKT